MSDSKSNKKTTGAQKAIGATLVALSGFVPQPFVQTARAGSTTLSVTGQLITGISMVKKADLKFGKVVATDTAGDISVSVAGAHAGATKAVGIDGQAQGKYTYKAVTTTAGFDITVKGIGALTLGSTTGGAAAVGTAKLVKVLFGKVFDTGSPSVTCTTAGGTTCKVAVPPAKFDVAAGSANIGGNITWTAQPTGAFGQTLTFIMSY